MKISNLRLVTGPSAVRAAARVTWEDCPRPPLDLFFEAGSTGMDDLAPEPEAFLTACILPAMKNGERRVLVEGPLCPRLAEGATAAVALLRSWYGPPRGPVAIEATGGFRAILPRRPERAALFLTGGVDSLHLLQTNRVRFPEDHPEFFADGLSVSGHLAPPEAPGAEERGNWSGRVLRALSAIAEDARIALVPLKTNLSRLEPDVQFLADESLSSGLAAAAHLFRGRWSSVSLASGRDAARLEFRGTHPLLDPLFSSSALEIRHAGIRFSRLERVQAIASWPCALENLVVCLEFPPPPLLNCGRCEKCVRTMTALLAVGKLPGARQFPATEVRPEMIRALSIGPLAADYWVDLVPLLLRQDRTDLVGIIEEKLSEARRLQRWFENTGWKGGLRRLDRRFFGGRLLKFRRRVFPGRSARESARRQSS